MKIWRLVLALVIIFSCHENCLLAEPNISDDIISEEIENVPIGTSWKDFVLSHPDLEIINFDIDHETPKVDPEKPHEMLGKLKTNPQELITYYFKSGSLEGVSVARVSGVDPQIILAKAYRIFGNAPKITRNRDEYREIYTWDVADRVMRVMIPIKGDGIAVQVMSSKFFKQSGLSELSDTQQSSTTPEISKVSPSPAPPSASVKHPSNFPIMPLAILAAIIASVAVFFLCRKTL